MTTNQDSPNTAGAAELKACPFCGSDEVSYGYMQGGATSLGNCECHSCNACIWADSEVEAIAAWNMRPVDAETPQQIFDAPFTPAAQELKSVADAIIRDICELDGEYDLSEDETVMMVNAEDLRVILDRYFPALDQIADHANCSVVPDDVVEAASLEWFSDDVRNVQSRIIIAHQLRASADIQDRSIKATTGWADTTDRAMLMRKAADAIERLTAAIPAIKAQVLAEIVAWLRMGEHVHSRSGSIESERVFKLIADAIERGEHEND